jgi:threonine dehydrogenase-like Zn-dependent dehydrogenase
VGDAEVMQAVRRGADGIETVTVPRPEGDGVRVRVVSAGICGSDLYALTQGPSPVILGHEFGGLLDDGTPVAVKPNGVCGECGECLRGDENLCRSAISRFYGQTLDGGMAEEVLVLPSVIVPLPPGLPVEVAGLVEPVAISVHGAHRGRVEAGMRVAVVGAGPIGLTMVLAARWLGAEVDVVARHPHQAAAADALGGSTVVGRNYDVVVDAVGSQAAVDQAIDLVRRGGTVVEVGGLWDPLRLGAKAMIKEVSFQPAVFSGHHHGEVEFEQAAAVLAATPHAAEVLITHRFELGQAAEAFRVAADKSTGSLKVHFRL